MPGEEWIKTLAGGRKVKFIYQELPVDGALLTAQLAGNEVVYSVVNPLSGVESRTKGQALRCAFALREIRALIQLKHAWDRPI